MGVKIETQRRYLIYLTSVHPQKINCHFSTVLDHNVNGFKFSARGLKNLLDDEFESRLSESASNAF